MIKASQVRLSQIVSPEQPDDSEIFNILSVKDAKAEFRILHSAEDLRIADAIRDAFHFLDGPYGKLNRALLRQTWAGTVDCFQDKIELPLPPLVSVTSITYLDEDGASQTLSTDIYGVETNGLMGYVYRKKDQDWPDVYDDPGSVTINFTAGWEDGDAVLQNAYLIRKAMKLLAGHFYHNPLPTFVEPRLVEVPRKVMFGLDYVMSRYRIMNDPS